MTVKRERVDNGFRCEDEYGNVFYEPGDGGYYLDLNAMQCTEEVVYIPENGFGPYDEYSDPDYEYHEDTLLSLVMGEYPGIDRIVASRVVGIMLDTFGGMVPETILMEYTFYDDIQMEFFQTGTKVWWEDPQHISSGYYEIWDFLGEDKYLISNETSEAEVTLNELYRPTGDKCPNCGGDLFYDKEGSICNEFCMKCDQRFD